MTLKNIKRKLYDKAVSKPILRNQRATVRISSPDSEPTRSYYFQKEYDKEKRSLFLK